MEEVVEAAAKNWQREKDVMQLLLSQDEKNIPIAEEVAKATAGNRDHKVMLLL
jgi:hypothetical protein